MGHLHDYAVWGMHALYKGTLTGQLFADLYSQLRAAAASGETESKCCTTLPQSLKQNE